MTTEYLILGIIIVVMGGIQTWLRRTSGETDAERKGVRSGKTWNAWTIVLGPISVIIGIVLIVLGITGR
jgi:uncharacterized membrane protein